MFNMKNILILLLLPIITTAKTLTPAGYVGSWSLEQELSYLGEVNITVKTDLSFNINRVFPDGDKVICEAIGNAQVSDEFVMLTCKTPYNILHKFVLGGWESESGISKIFGTMFLYNDKGLFNGIPVHFKKT